MLEAIDLIWFAVYVALGLASIAVVRKAGPDAMDTRYVIEEEYDRETGPKNGTEKRSVSNPCPDALLRYPCFLADHGGRLRFDPFAAMEGSSPCYILAYTWRN